MSSVSIRTRKTASGNRYVARKLGRRAVGIDLNEQYLEMAARRLQQQSLFALDNG